MYKGRRDDHISIRIPQERCYKYRSSTGQDFIELVLEDNTATNDTWISLMVDPKQVFYDHTNPDKFNIIEGLNRNTNVSISIKSSPLSKSRSIVPNSEIIIDPMGLYVYLKDYN